MISVFINQTLIATFIDYKANSTCKEVCARHSMTVLQYKHLQGKDVITSVFLNPPLPPKRPIL